MTPQPDETPAKPAETTEKGADDQHVRATPGRTSSVRIEAGSPSSAVTPNSSSSSSSKTINSNVQNSFSADSPYFSSYVDNEMYSMSIMNDTLKDIAARTKTFGKCGALMSESTRRLALACRLRRPVVVEEGKDAEEVELHHEMEVAARRRAIGDDMAGLLAVMSEVSEMSSLLLLMMMLLLFLDM